MPPSSSSNADQPDDAVLVRLMRSLDGELSDEEQAQLEADMLLHPEWHDLKADMARGTKMAQLALASDAAKVDDRARNAAARPHGIFQAKAPNRRSSFFAGYRQAAAILISFALGVAAAASAFTILGNANQDSGLRLAGIDASPDSEDLQQHALARLLLPLLSADYGADRRIDVDDASANLHGRLSVDRGFQLGQNIPCVEFLFTPRDTVAGHINGIACQSPTDGWQVMTITADK